MSKCRYCSLPIAGLPAPTVSYWNATPDVCHAECKTDGVKTEALECQAIDADCNDCRHFQRGQLHSKRISRYKKPDGSIAEVVFIPNIFDGHCRKFNQPTQAYPNMSTGRKCFEHRRTP